MIPKNEIKIQLWRLGHRITDVSGIVGYDLLVDNKWKVKVIASKIKSSDIGEYSVITSGCDIVAVVTTGAVPNKFYSAGKQFDNSLTKFSDWQKPFRIFK